MNYHERGFRRRRLTSIPLITPLDVVRRGGRGVTLQIGGDSLFGGARRVSREMSTKKVDWSNGETDWNVDQHVFRIPQRREKARPGSHYERDGKIEWEAEVIEDYNGKGNMGIILQFAGIGLTKVSFLRSRHNKLDSPVFYIPIDYNKRIARLFLATRGDIFESQIVPAQMDVNPFFQEELYLPQLTTTYDPTSMTVSQNNGLIAVGYKPVPTR